MIKRSLVFVSILFIITGVAHAFSFNLDKPGITLASRGGKTLDGYVEVRNNSQETMRFVAYLNDWQISPDGSKQFFPAGTTELSCSNWISISPKEFTVEPGKKARVNYVMTVPEGVSGGHYSVLFVETALPSEKKAKVLLSGRIGSIFYHQTLGSEQINADLADLTVQADTANIALNYQFVNKGNIYLQVKPTLAVLDDQGKIIFRKKLEKFGVMPAQSLDRNDVVAKALPLRSYTAVLTTEYGVDAFDVLEKAFTVNDIKLASPSSTPAKKEPVAPPVVKQPADQQQDAVPQTTLMLKKFNPVISGQVIKLNVLLAANSPKVTVVANVTDVKTKKVQKVVLANEVPIKGSKLITQKFPPFAKGKYAIRVVVSSVDQKLEEEKTVEIK